MYYFEMHNKITSVKFPFMNIQVDSLLSTTQTHISNYKYIMICDHVRVGLTTSHTNPHREMYQQGTRAQRCTSRAF